MDKNIIIELTKDLYKITLLFPKKEPLRYKAREIADEIMQEIVSFSVLKEDNPNKYSINAVFKEKEIAFSLEKNLDIIDSYFEVAKWQRWLDYFDILEIQKRYAKIRENLLLNKERTETSQSFDFSFKLAEKKEELKEEQLNKKKEEKEERLGERKEKILKILEKTERIQVGEMNKLFPDVSKRTLRRDFQNLVSKGLAQKIGQKNNTFYKISPPLFKNSGGQAGRTE